MHVAYISARLVRLAVGRPREGHQHAAISATNYHPVPDGYGQLIHGVFVIWSTR